jgi:hypothetical protein
MVTDSKKANSNDLITKIKSLQETIDKQSTVSLIDIDLQLDNIRTLYESYILLREDIMVQKEKNKKKSNLSECGTLPLFDDMEEDINTEEEPQKEIDSPAIEEEIQQIETEDLEKEVIPEFLEIPEEIQEVEVPAIEVDEPEVELEINIEENELLQEFVSEIEEKNNEEKNNETDEIEEELEEDFEENLEEDETEEDIVSIPDMDIELDVTTSATPSEQIISSTQEEELSAEKSHFVAEIDIDSIEFAEDEDDEDDDSDEDEEEIQPSQSSHMGIPSGRPVYWGDEVDIEQPIAAKPTSIGDKFKNEKPSLNEIVSGFKPDSSIGMKLQNESITDLMKSIDMNNKFLFVKELFKGNGSAFTEEINNLNNHSKLDGALRYLDKIKEKYHWDEKSEAYYQLYHLILRKYAK